MEKEEKELIRALRKGKADKAERAFSRVYEAYLPLVRAVISRYVGNPSDIEELSQEVFADFYRKASSVDGSLKGYLAKSSANKAVDLLRKRGRESELEREETVMEEPLNPRAIAFEEWARGVVGAEDWRLVYLHLLAGYSFEEISLEGKGSAAKLKTRYYRALRKLRKEGEDL